MEILTMNVLEHLDAIPEVCKGATLAIGNFDGVHRGHQALLAKTREIASAGSPSVASRQPENSEQVAGGGPTDSGTATNDRPAAKSSMAGVMIFEPHPREFFSPDQPHFRLTTLGQRLGLLAIYGMDLAVVLPFNKQFAGLAAQDFISDILVDKLAISHVVIGYDFFFGKGRTGNVELMKQAGAELGFGVSVIEPVAHGGEVFSSSGVRALLGQGEVENAAAMLGHWWRVIGEVTGGAKRGTGLGFPTANISLPSSTVLAHGIYSVRVYTNYGRHHGAAYLGTRPTFDDGLPVLEVFLFDFEGDLYGQDIEVEFIEHIREDMRFTDGDALKVQMAKDCDAARATLEKIESDDPYARPNAVR